MPDKTDKHDLESILNTQSENIPDGINPINISETINPNQETRNMETHAHELHKAPGHGWKHYFFEFFMLFLAITLGFYAENLREGTTVKFYCRTAVIQRALALRLVQLISEKYQIE